MALLIWAAWEVTKKVESEKLKAEMLFNHTLQLKVTTSTYNQSPLVKQGTLYFNDSSRLKTCEMKKVNMLLPFMQQLKRKLNRIVQWMNRRDNDPFDNPYVIY